ncbi:MAG TPA: branched-chain amino acid aminotransferase [Planctomycetaceae bacterium]|nr:branched-chain amino acid aminotransferase [Planctomycetaceae bacterium]
MKSLLNDECGFVVSAELILVATIAVLGLVVGLAEVRQAVSAELEDVATAIGSMNQSYCFTGLYTQKAHSSGSYCHDHADFCDGQNDIVGTDPTREGQNN